MIELYGPVGTSADRCYWTLEEIGVPYEVAPFDFRKKDHRSERFLALNPNGKVPVLRDGDLVLWESLAINRYLAARYAPALLGEGLAEQALVDQWSVWALVEYQPQLVTLLIQRVFVPEERRDAELIADAEAKLAPRLAIIDAHLAEREHMVGDRFTLADLNIASVTRICGAVGVDISDRPSLSRWYAAMTARPAFARVRARDRAR